MASGKVLLVTDRGLERGWKTAFAAQGFDLDTRPDSTRAIELIDTEGLDAVVIRPPLRGEKVEEVLAALRLTTPRVPVVIVDPEVTPREVFEICRTSSAEYHFDARSPGPLAGTVRQVVERSRAARSGPPTGSIDAILGQAAITRELRATVLKIARSAATTILLLGESGTGKDLVAHALHESSPRAAAAFVPINCSAIPEALLESELFGHEPGAFTDAKTLKLGLLELANGGTVFLDEVAELSMPIQAKILRFLEERTLKRLGGTRDIPVDLRIISGTHVDLEEAVSLQRFRQDLFFRLQVVPVHLPPLRERVEDIPVLARHFLDTLNLRFHKRFGGFAPDAMRRLVEHLWPGNIRELKNAVERVVLLEDGSSIESSMLDFLRPALEATRPEPVSVSQPPDRASLRWDDLELDTLLRALEQCHGNQSEAARRLGVSRDTVRHRINKFGIRLETRAIVTLPLDRRLPAREAESGS